MTDAVNKPNTTDGDPITMMVADILGSIAHIKPQLTALQQKVRSLERAAIKERNAYKRAIKKKTPKGDREPSGFARPTKISAMLAEFLSVPSDTLMARTEVTKRINSYIAEHDLQDKDNRQTINPDKKLAELLKTNTNDTVTYFNLQKYMNPHFTQ